MFEALWAGVNVGELVQHGVDHQSERVELEAVLRITKTKTDHSSANLSAT
jgi:hypothetical protein